MKSDDLFSQFLAEAKKDHNILGVILLGSRGKGFSTQYSDYDFIIIVKDEVIKEYEEKLEKMDKSSHFDCSVMTLESFREYAAWGTEFSWDRYSFTNIEPQIDKTAGELVKLIEEKSVIPPEHFQNYLETSLDAYINSVYRSMKGLRDGNEIAYRFEAAESIIYLLRVIFAFHNGRIAPFYKYLKNDLEKYPLEKINWFPEQFLGKIFQILENGAYDIQQEIMIEIEKIARKEGFGHIFDGWEGEEKWAMTFKPENYTKL